MGFSALARNARRLLPLLVAAAFLAVLTGSAGAQAADTSSTQPPAASQGTATPTTATGQGGIWPTTTSVSGQTDGSSTTTAAVAGQGLQPAPPNAVVPPAADETALNPGWKTDQMEVRVLPEYDEPSVLVIMSFSLPADVPLPATLKLAVPAGARIAGIGEIDPNGNFKYNYDTAYPPTVPGATWDTTTIEVKNYRDLQIDYYYDPGLPQGAGPRSFPLLVKMPMDVGTLVLHVQHPAKATDFAADPVLQGSGKAGDGFTYSVAAYPDIKAGSTLGHTVSYVSPDGALSVNAQDPQSTGTTFDTNTMLLAAILVIVVIVGALVLYRMYSNSRRPNGRSKRPAPAQNSARSGTPINNKRQPQSGKASKATGKAAAKGATAKAVPSSASPAAVAAAAAAAADYVAAAPEAGQGSGAAAEYCVACGEELTEDPFCPNCGEARP